MIDITPADQEIVTTILKKHVPHAEVRVFGSRHKWTAKPYSDLDLAIVADAKLEKQIIYDLEEAFEESELSFRVDVIDWYAISDEFRAIIEQGYTVIQEKKEALPAGWVMKKLGEISIKLASGATPKGGDSSYKSSGISLIRSQNILDFTFSYNGLVFIDNDQANKLQNVEIKENDVLINITGDSVTRCCSVPNQVLPARVNQHVMIIRVNNKVCDSNYIKYYLLNPISKSHLLSLSSSGATRKALTKTMMDNLKIWLPPLQEQKKIAAILSSLDDKIELNQQINKKLEEMAQAIFKEWFIDFNFPDENGNPYRDAGGAMIDSELGQIPAYWSVGKLGEEFNITMGQSPVGSSYNESKEGMIFFQGRTDFGTRFPSIRLFTTEPKRIAKKFDILLSVRAPVGDINIALQYCCIGRGLAAINAENKSYCYYKLQFLQQQFNIYNGTGTVFGAINKDQLHGLSVVIATQNVVRNFEDVVSKIDEKIYHNHLEILNLQNTRDTLLPKLLSGEILA